MDEKRIEPRSKKRIVVEYTIKGGFGSSTIVRTNTTDISPTGMRLGLSRRIPNSQDHLDCRLYFDHVTLRVEAEIVWRSGTMMGVRFRRPDPSLRLAIAISHGVRGTGPLHLAKVPVIERTEAKPVLRDFDDLSEKWISRTVRAVDPHERWLSRHYY